MKYRNREIMKIRQRNLFNKKKKYLETLQGYYPIPPTLLQIRKDKIERIKNNIKDD